jgi:twitching motility protein PilT
LWRFILWANHLPLRHERAPVYEPPGTDLHLTAGSAPLVRVDGVLHAVPDQPVLKPADTEAIAEVLLDEADREVFTRRGDVDFAFGFDHLARIRGRAYAQRGSTTLALRMIPSKIPSMDDLGLPESIQQMVDSPSGLLLVTGPTGSGKSTTMASMIDHIARTRFCHLLTIEERAATTRAAARP